MDSTQPLSATDVAKQFQAEQLAPRTEIWSKDIERASPSIQGQLAQSN
jgi:hypothetical protein